MLSLDFAVTATMLMIATASIIIAIVPNSGTTCFVAISPEKSTYCSLCPNPTDSIVITTGIVSDASTGKAEVIKRTAQEINGIFL